MTEASHQIASNPLPPRARKPGSVGLPAAGQIAIMDEEGSLLSQGQTVLGMIRHARLSLFCRFRRQFLSGFAAVSLISTTES